jgi:hypothetical protein
LIISRNEGEQLAELNLLASQRAKATAAYASALTYLTAGAALLPEDSWERRQELIFALELDQAECEFVTVALAEAEQRLAVLSTRAANTVERAAVACSSAGSAVRWLSLGAASESEDRKAYHRGKAMSLTGAGLRNRPFPNRQPLTQRSGSPVCWVYRAWVVIVAVRSIARSGPMGCRSSMPRSCPRLRGQLQGVGEPGA